MTTTQRREKFKKTFAKVPIMMLQDLWGNGSNVILHIRTQRPR